MPTAVLFRNVYAAIVDTLLQCQRDQELEITKEFLYSLVFGLFSHKER